VVGSVLSPEQETKVINMVLENHAITLQQIQRKIIENNDIFQNIDRVSVSTLDRVLHRNHPSIKQVPVGGQSNEIQKESKNCNMYVCASDSHY